MKAATRFWHRLEDGRVRCDVCPRRCRLREGQRGFCYVRAAEHGQVVLTTYGRSSGFCVDPIEKKPLFHFLPGSSVLSFGTAGCNLACRYCQNWELSHVCSADVLAEVARPETIARAAARLGCRGVAFTYNDPVVFCEYALDTARACRARGLRAVAVSNGYVLPEPRAELFGAMDAVNIDLKSFREETYARVCGGHLEPVLDTLRWLAHESRTWLEVTTLVVPGLNDGNDELEQLAHWIAVELGPDVPLHLTAFHPAGRMQDVPPTPGQTLTRLRTLAQRAGLRHVYTGNVRDRDGGQTRCHACRALLIGRDGYELGAWRLAAGGRCPRCGTRCAGVFEDRPGGRGRRRRPASLSM